MLITFKYNFIFIRDLSIIGIWISLILREVYNDDIIQKQRHKKQMSSHQNTTCEAQLKSQV